MMTDNLRWPLAAIAVCGLVLSAAPVLWMLRRMVRALMGRPQPPISSTRYVMALVTSALLGGLAAAAFGLLLSLESWHAFTKKTHVGELQCIELQPGKLRVYFVPILDDGTRGATETYDLDGDQWAVWGDVLRLKPFLSGLGLSTVYQVSRVEGHWTKAEDANAHKGSAYDRSGGTGPTWLQLYKEGTKGPMGWLVAGVHGQAVSQLPDRRAVYDLYVTANGFIVDKRAL